VVELSDRKKADPAWQYAMRLMMKAAAPNATQADLAKGERQLSLCLRRHGVMGIRRDGPPSRPRWRRR
jgi:hypothetical protein